MRAAPAVSVRCSRAGAWRWLRALTPALASAALLAWAAGPLQQPALASPALMLPLALLVAAMAWRWSRLAPVQLAWDGQTWSANDTAGQLELKIDLGPWLLLHLRAQDKAFGGWWIAVSAAEAGPAMHGLRAALYGRPPGPGAGARTPEPGDAARAR